MTLARLPLPSQADCVYDHFQRSNECPVCHKRLGESDFMQLSVTESTSANAAPNADLQQLFQKLFTKGTNSRGSQHVQYMDACQAAYQAQQLAGKLTRFLYKQFWLASQMTGHSSGKHKQEKDQIMREYTAYQQQTNADKLKISHEIRAYQDKIQSLSSQLAKKKVENDDLKQEVEAFRRQLHRQGLGGRTSSIGGGASTSSSRHHGYAPEVQRLPQFINTNRQPEPTPIIPPNDSFLSDRGTATGAPPVRQVPRGSYYFSGSNRSVGSGTSSNQARSGGPIQTLQHQNRNNYSYGRSQSFGGRRR